MKIKVGILGGAGYTAGELIRLLTNHPEVEIAWVNSESNAGNRITDVHEGLYGETDMSFTSEMPFSEADVLFFCFGHGKSEAFLKEHRVPDSVRIIDLAQDFRLDARWQRLRLRLARNQPRAHPQSAPRGQPRMLCHMHTARTAARRKDGTADERHRR